MEQQLIPIGETFRNPLLTNAANIKKIAANVDLFRTFSQEHDLIAAFTPPRAGSISFVPLNINVTARAFSDQLVKEAGIMTLPAEMFDYEGKYIRVGFGRQDFSEALNALDQYLLSK